MRVRVECLSGYKVNERPLKFYLNESLRVVRRILDQWLGPDYVYFKVLADDDCTYILKYDERADAWDLQLMESSPRPATQSGSIYRVPPSETSEDQ